MDKSTILAVHGFGRARLLATLDAIEKSGQDMAKVLAWRPGHGRAHIGWQAMHCAATHDRYLNVNLLGGTVKDETLVANFAGGSKPSDTNVPTLAAIRTTLEANFAALKSFIESADDATLAKVQTLANGAQRTVADSLVLLAWHEAHHQGQIHLTWNLYQGAHGVK